VTDDKLESNNLDDSLRRQGATSGNPIQNIQDYGLEVGGPIKKGRAWIWGSYGKQNIKVGVLGFYQPTDACQALKSTSVPLATPIDTINGCLNTDLTTLQTTNLKAEVQLFKGNKLSLFNNFAKKVRNARGADDLHPIETTTPQDAVPSGLGSTGGIPDRTRPTRSATSGSSPIDCWSTCSTRISATTSRWGSTRLNCATSSRRSSSRPV
jgi:hypothetical protein